MDEMKFGYSPTHPGEVVKDEIEYRGISQRALAESVGMTYSVINEILNGRRPVSTRTALMFEAALGIPAYILVRLQEKYDMQTAKADRELSARLRKIRRFEPVPAVSQ